MAHAIEFLDGFLDQLKANLGVRHFTTTELEAQLHFIAMIEEFLGVAELGHKIIRLDADSEFDFLDLAGRRFAVRMLLLFLVHILAEIHDAAHGRNGRGRNLHEIEIKLDRERHRFRRVHNAELSALGADHANLR